MFTYTVFVVYLPGSWVFYWYYGTQRFRETDAQMRPLFDGINVTHFGGGE